MANIISFYCIFRVIHLNSVSTNSQGTFPPVSSRQTSRQLARLQPRYVPFSRLQSTLSSLHSKLWRLNTQHRFSTIQNARWNIHRGIVRSLTNVHTYIWSNSTCFWWNINFETWYAVFASFCRLTLCVCVFAYQLVKVIIFSKIRRLYCIAPHAELKSCFRCFRIALKVLSNPHFHHLTDTCNLNGKILNGALVTGSPWATERARIDCCSGARLEWDRLRMSPSVWKQFAHSIWLQCFVISLGNETPFVISKLHGLW